MVIVIVAVIGAIGWYVWARLIRDPAWRWPGRRSLTALYTIVVLTGVMAMSTEVDPLRRQLGAGRIAGMIAFSAFLQLWIGFALVSIPKRIATRLTRRIAARRARPDENAGPAKPEAALDRRQFVARVTASAVGITATTASIVGYRNAWDITTPEIPVQLARLPKALDGFRLVQLSDLHLGRLTGSSFLERVIELTERQRPDAVVITGDLMEGTVARLTPLIEPLGALASRRPVYFTTGNHDYYAGDATKWVEVLTRLGVRVLVNEHVRLGDASRSGASFDLGGIPDRTAGRFVPSHEPNVEATLAGRDPERALVLLAHQPAQIESAENRGVGLQLSGHTHGGQFFPIGILERLAMTYVSGLHRHRDGTQIYVSRGTGFFGPALRTFAPAELPVIVLTT